MTGFLHNNKCDNVDCNVSVFFSSEVSLVRPDMEQGSQTSDGQFRQVNVTWFTL